MLCTNRLRVDFVSLAPGLADMIELAARSSVLDTPAGKKKSSSGSTRRRFDESESDHDPDSDINESIDDRSSITSFAVNDESDFISPTKQFVLATGRPSRSSHTRSSKVNAALKITRQLQAVEGDENFEPNMVDRDD